MFDLTSIRIADIADMLVVSVCVFVALRWIQTTASRSLAIAAGSLVLVYAIAVTFDLHLTTLLFQFGLTIAAVVFVVVFQDDIRRAVERVLLAGRWRARSSNLDTNPHVETLLETVYSLAECRRGALIVLAGEEPLDAHLDGGTELLGQISQPLLDSLFDPHSAGHDGAVIIKDGFVTRFGVHLPLSENREKSQGLGTRHRSALGMSELSDAMIVVVSEERGHASIAQHGELRRNMKRDELRSSLNDHLKHVSTPQSRSLWSSLTSHREQNCFPYSLRLPPGWRSLRTATSWSESFSSQSSIATSQRTSTCQNPRRQKPESPFPPPNEPSSSSLQAL